MILPALIGYYDRLEAHRSDKVPPFGFSVDKIGFVINISRDGIFNSIMDIREIATDYKGKKKLVGRPMIVPGVAPRTSKPHSYLLSDNAAYMLGIGPNASKKHSLFVDQHLALEVDIGDSSFSSICRFLSGWDKSRFKEPDRWDELNKMRGCFRVDGDQKYAHEISSVQEKIVFAYSKKIDWPGEATSSSRSLLDNTKIAAPSTHAPRIQGVKGSQSSGAAIVSFNKSAFESYSKNQSENSPLSTNDIFKYCTSLNILLSDRSHRSGIGDATVVWWSEAAGEAGEFGESMVGALFGVAPPEAAEDARTSERVGAAMSRITRGLVPEGLGDSRARFYVLGLSPNAARLSVRFWWDGTLGEMVGHIARHHADLQIAGMETHDRPFSIQQILWETVRDRKDVSPRLAGEVANAVLEGRPYPPALLSSILRRIRADGSITPSRAAILKAIAVRQGDTEVDMYLNKRHPSSAYHCGRLLATLAFAQDKALGKINTGVVKRNMGSVMATPGIMLGRLQRAAEVGHIPKLDGSLPQFVQDELIAINIQLKDAPPKHLNAYEQSIFALGYYQETGYVRWVGEQVLGNHRHRSDLGEWMRSKLEVRVAKAMTKAGITYIYEPSAMLDATERWPDFLIRGSIRTQDVYVEVAGYRGPGEDDYNERHNQKIEAYHKVGIQDGGGDNGHLVVLDYRPDDVQFDDMSVIHALRFLSEIQPESPSSSQEN